MMKIWRYNEDALEECFSFVRFVKGEGDYNELSAVTNAVFTALWPVVRPFSVALAMAARSPREFPFIDSQIPVPATSWHLLERELPAYITLRKFEQMSINPSEYSEEEIPELTLQALADWLARAHAQQLAEGYVPVLDSLDMNITRARLLGYQKPYAELAGRSRAYAVPVEKREDGFWVSRSIVEERIRSPIEVTLANFHGRLTLEISVYWSPWIEAGSAEEELLLACPLELEKQGWEAD